MTTPDLAKIEEAPHFLKLLEEYAKTAVTLSLALISVSVAYVDQSLGWPMKPPQLIVLGLLWLALFGALLSGLRIISLLTGVSSNYMRALRIAYPDPLVSISQTGSIPQSTPPAATAPLSQQHQDDMKASLDRARKFAVAASAWASFSLWMFGFASILIISLGIYSSIFQTSQVDAASAVDAAVLFVGNKFGINEVDILLSSVSYSETQKAYTIELKNVQSLNETYVTTIEEASGKILRANIVP